MLELDEVRAAIEERGAAWSAEQTEVAILASEQGAEHLFGLALTDAERDELFGAAALSEQESGFFAAAAQLPAVVDWREGGWVTPARAQGACQACVAFALCATFEARVRIGKQDSGI